MSRAPGIAAQRPAAVRGDDGRVVAAVRGVRDAALDRRRPGRAAAAGAAAGQRCWSTWAAGPGCSPRTPPGSATGTSAWTWSTPRSGWPPGTASARCGATCSGCPVGDGVADAVSAGEILEHVPDLRAAVAEACRVLRPGGTLVLDTLAATWVAKLVTVTIGERIPGGAPPGIHDPALFVDRDLLVAEAGRHGVRLTLRGMRPPVLGMLRWLARLEAGIPGCCRPGRPPCSSRGTAPRRARDRSLVPGARSRAGARHAGAALVSPGRPDMVTALGLRARVVGPPGSARIAGPPGSARIVGMGHALPAPTPSRASGTASSPGTTRASGSPSGSSRTPASRTRHAVVNPVDEDVSGWGTGRRMERYLAEALPLGKDAVTAALADAGVDPGEVGPVRGGVLHRVRHPRGGHPAGPRPRHVRPGAAARRRAHGLLRGAARAGRGGATSAWPGAGRRCCSAWS